MTKHEKDTDIHAINPLDTPGLLPETDATSIKVDVPNNQAENNVPPGWPTVVRGTSYDQSPFPFRYALTRQRTLLWPYQSPTQGLVAGGAIVLHELQEHVWIACSSLLRFYAGWLVFGCT